MTLVKKNFTLKKSSKLIYKIDDKPPFTKSLVLAIQHLLSMFLSVVTPSILFCKALDLPDMDSRYIINMSVFSSGLASLLQIKTIGPIGSGLLSIQGTSFNFITPLITIGTFLKSSGFGIHDMMSIIFGSLMISSCTEIVFSQTIYLLKRFITPIVSGIIITIVGVSLIQVNIISIVEYNFYKGDFLKIKYLFLFIVVLSSIIILNFQKNSNIRIFSILISVLIGCFLSKIIGWNFIKISNTNPIFEVPIPFHYGINFQANIVFPFVIVFIITSIETIGDITATSVISEQSIHNSVYINRLKGGILANGINSMISAIFNTFPNSCFIQNNCIIRITGTASRYVGILTSMMLICIGLFPSVSDIIRSIPEPVIAGSSIFMFGTITCSGIRIMLHENINYKKVTIILISLMVGVGISQKPSFFRCFPQWMKIFFSSGVSSGGITAVLLNIFFTLFSKKKPSEKLKIE